LNYGKLGSDSHLTLSLQSYLFSPS
jgi:hypothetical protein